jgi:hypothetical protein
MMRNAVLVNREPPAVNDPEPEDAHVGDEPNRIPATMHSPNMLITDFF